MKIGGIIAEYNPFHYGHRYQIEMTKELGELTHIVAVMSSNYVQRGETALFSKWARAEMAVKNGVDLVVEMPTMWSSANAQRFALGGVSLLDSLGCVDMLSFGSECGNIDELIECKDVLNSEVLEERLRENLDVGLGFATARAEALKAVAGNKFFGVLEKPNNTLAIEYLNAIDTLGSKLIPMTIKRIGVDHDSSKRIDGLTSASDIRDMILKNDAEWEKYVPETVAEIINRELEKGSAPCPITKLEFSILCCMRQLSAEAIGKSPDVSEGIEYRIHDAALKAGSLEELYQLAKTKRYSHARIRRIVLHAFMGFVTEDYVENPPYIHVLAMNDRGKEILKAMKETCKLPIITKASDFDELEGFAKHVYALEDMCTDVFSLASPSILPCGREKTEGIFVLGEEKDEEEKQTAETTETTETAETAEESAEDEIKEDVTELSDSQPTEIAVEEEKEEAEEEKVTELSADEDYTEE